MGNRKAVSMVNEAVKKGLLPAVKTLTCIDCGKPATEYDHRDYFLPLNVEPTCRKCNHRRGAAMGWHDDMGDEIAITIRMPKDLKDKAVADAEKRDMSLSMWIRAMIKRAK